MKLGIALALAMFVTTAQAEPNGTPKECAEVKEIATLSFALGLSGANGDIIFEELVANEMVSEWSDPTIREFTDLILNDVDSRYDELEQMVNTTIKAENLEDGIEEIKAYIETHAEKWELSCLSVPA